MRIAICIITRRRPGPLARLLRSLEAMAVPDGVEVRLVVVENDDPGGPPPTTSMRFVHAFEPRPGIPAARNRTLDLALADPTTAASAFLDDAETVEADWLERLLAGRRRVA